MLNRETRERLELTCNWLTVLLAFCLPVFRRGVSVSVSLLILLWLIQGSWRLRVRTLVRIGPVLAVALFFVLSVLSLLWSENLGDGLIYVLKYRYFLLVPIIATTLRPIFRERVFWAFLGGYTLSLVWSYGIALGVIHFGKGYPDNPSPTMLHLDYSIFLAFGSLLVLNRILHRTMKWQKLVPWLLFLAFSASALFFNIGRSGQLAFAGTLMVLVVVVLRHRSLVLSIAAVLVVGLLLCGMYFAVPTFEQRVNSAVLDVRAVLRKSDYNSNQGKRLAAMVVTLDMIKSRPILGAGVGDTMVEFRELLDTDYPEFKEAVYWFPHLHNQYLQASAELGLLGLLALLNILVQLPRTKLVDKEMARLSLILSCLYFFAFVGDPFFHKQLPLALFAFTSGVILAEKGNPEWFDSESAHGSSPS